MKYKPQPLYLHGPSFSTPSISRVEKQFWQRWLALHEPPDTSDLYHYTTLDGLQGILTNRSLWLGHVSCLNDRTEIQHGERIVNGILRDTTQKESGEDIRVFIDSMTNWIRLFGGQSIHHVFVVSFCKSGNLLSQWRSYSERGQGYCLGFQFSAETLVASDLTALEEGKAPYLRRVIYSEETQRELVEDYVSKVIEAVKVALEEGGSPDAPRRSNINVMAIQAANILMDMILTFKHPAFESEDEWRLVRVTRQDFDAHTLKFRESNGELMPYRPTFVYDRLNGKAYKFPLRSIGFGPSLEPARTRATISLLLQHLAGSDHAIKLDAGLRIFEAGYSLRS